MCTKESEVAQFLEKNYKKKDGKFVRHQKYYIKDNKNCVRAFQCDRTFDKGSLNPTTGEVFEYNTCFGKALNEPNVPFEQDDRLFRNNDGKVPFLLDDDPKDAPHNEVWYRTCPMWGCPTKSVSALGGRKKRKSRKKMKR